MASYVYCNAGNTTFPWNLAVAKFYFKSLFGAATIQGRLDFEGGIHRDRHTGTYTTSIISLFIYTHNVCVHTVFPWIPPIGTNFRVLTCRYNSRAGTIRGQLQWLSQHFHAHMRTALLSDSARTSMKFAHDLDKWTWFSCTVQLSNRR